MTTHCEQGWFHLALYRLTMLLAAALGALVLFAPLVFQQPGREWSERACYLFAQDAVLRRVAVASAVGLWITAVVFFRPPQSRPHAPREGLSSRGA